jgi:hypothetical protein
MLTQSGVENKDNSLGAVYSDMSLGAVFRDKSLTPELYLATKAFVAS